MPREFENSCLWSPLTKEQRCNAVYSIPCNDCDHEYVGQTKRQFGTRLKEHQRAVCQSKIELNFSKLNFLTLNICGVVYLDHIFS